MMSRELELPLFSARGTQLPCSATTGDKRNYTVLTEIRDTLGPPESEILVPG